MNCNKNQNSLLLAMGKFIILFVLLLFTDLQCSFSQKPISGRITGSGDTLDVIGVNTDTLAFEDVVVTAFGIPKQSKGITYASQNVKPENLFEARNTNLMSGLSGKVAGMSITTAGQGVGAGSRVILRGIRSIAGSSQPIYVVDGITLNGDIDNLSPDDIESITVLKGANGAALYGNRASNGAIVVATKSGKGAREGVSVRIGFNYQFIKPIVLLKFQNIYGQGTEGIYYKESNYSWGPKMIGQLVEHWSIDPNYYMYGKTYPYSAQPDNINDFFQTGHSFATNFQVISHSNLSNIFMSYTNTNVEGMVDGNDMKGHNLNMRVISNLTKKISIDTKFNIIRETYNNIFLSGVDFDNPIRYLYTIPRNIRTEDFQHYEFINTAGELKQHFFRDWFDGSGNPYWWIYNAVQPQTRNRVIAMLSIKYQLLKDLCILGRSGWDGSYLNTEWKRNNGTLTTAYNGSYSKYNSSSYGWNSDVLVNYNKKISNFSIDLNAGANNYLSEYQMVGGSGYGFNIENLFALSNTSNPRPTEDYSKKVINSVFEFAELSWGNAIFLNLTGRNDWSSTLPATGRSYFYPSVGLAAVISDLMTLPRKITYLKLRGSYAVVGNDANPYQLDRTATFGPGGVVSLSSIIPNANLKPETTKSIETGFDLRLLQDRIRLGFTWYKTNTYDQLFATPVPVTSGATSVFRNGADIQNRGAEITLGVAFIRGRDFSWDIGFNWAKNTSEVVKIAEGFNALSLGKEFFREYKLVEGDPYGDIYSTGFQRDAYGNVIMYFNGIPEVNWSVKCANFNPDWIGGISNNLTWKNFNFSTLIDIRWGGTYISGTEIICAGNGVLDYTTIGREGNLLFGRDVFKGEKGVTEYGEVNTVTTNAQNFWQSVGGEGAPIGEAFVRDATNIRMREMILGYNLPKALFSRSPFTAARVSLVGRNLFFLLNKAEQTDPEILTSSDNTAEGIEALAMPTTCTFGISLVFDF
jgi:TonB-linked SusC/RagA family outer membrane protein